MLLKYLALISLIPLAVANFIKGRLVVQLYNKGIKVERKWIYYINVPHLREQDKGDDPKVTQLINRLILVTHIGIGCSLLTIGLLVVMLLNK